MKKRIIYAWGVANAGFSMMGIFWIPYWPFFFVFNLLKDPPDIY